MNRPLKVSLALFGAFFALYALMAQRGLGWGDSGEFQYRILQCAGGALSGCDSYATAHPLYVTLGKVCCRTPFQVTLLSSFFGALSVAAFFLCARKAGLAVLFGLSHMLWWLSCLAEVQTMNLAFTALETLFLLRFLATDRCGWMALVLFLSGLHLSCHNFALLALPVYGVLLLRAGWKPLFLSALAWCAGASGWLWAIIVRGPSDVLFGSYGAQVAGFLPRNWTVTGFNLTLAALSFAVPAALVWWNRQGRSNVSMDRRRIVLWALFGINALFWVRYFVPDQATFLLPTLFFAFLLVSDFETRGNRTVALAALQVLLPVLAGQVFAQLPRPDGRTAHTYRDDATYFAWPWKFHDTSADRLAAETEGVWNGYPEANKGAAQ